MVNKNYQYSLIPILGSRLGMGHQTFFHTASDETRPSLGTRLLRLTDARSISRVPVPVCTLVTPHTSIPLHTLTLTPVL